MHKGLTVDLNTSKPRMLPQTRTVGTLGHLIVSVSDKTLYFHNTPALAFPPQRVCHPVRCFWCLSEFKSFERRHDTLGESGRQDVRVVGGFARCSVLLLAAKCLPSPHEGICVYLSVSALLSPLISCRSGQALRMKIWSSITSF